MYTITATDLETGAVRIWYADFDEYMETLKYINSDPPELANQFITITEPQD